MKKFVLGFSAAALLSACAATDDKVSQMPREEKIVQTGSHLPRRDRGDMNNVKTVSPEAFEGAVGQATNAPAPGR